MDRSESGPFFIPQTFPLSDDKRRLFAYTVGMMNEMMHTPKRQTSSRSIQCTRVLIADDRPRTRDSLRALLLTCPGYEVVGQAINGKEAIELVEQYQPDVVLMDVRMPDMDGLEATRLIKSRWPATKVIVLTMHSGYQAAALDAGASAFLSKGAPPEKLLSTLSQFS
ncbi:MAG: Transcriptional regulatory protein DegU [Anaerolineales bacterium]|nr:Transcriptional regulatory protein DegU [Anaerolineales bacterium]